MIKIKEANLPFNILGMPAYFGYYITHSWTADGKATMSIAPNNDSDKPKLDLGQIPAEELTVTLLQEDV